MSHNLRGKFCDTYQVFNASDRKSRFVAQIFTLSATIRSTPYGDAKDHIVQAGP